VDEDNDSEVTDVTPPAVVGYPLAVDTWSADQPRFPKLRETIDVVDPGLKVHDRKLFNVLLAHSYEVLKTDPNRTFAASGSDLKRAIGMHPKKANPVLDQSLERLQQTLIVIGYNSTDGQLRRRKLSLLITSDVPASEGVVFWRFHPELAPYLANPAEYAMIYLTVSAKFTSGYSLRLYELLALRVQAGEFAWTMDLATLRKQLGAEEPSYDHVGSLNRKVLNPAVSEINDYAPFKVEVTPNTVPVGKGKQKVVSITFQISKIDKMIEVNSIAIPKIPFCLGLRTQKVMEADDVTVEVISDNAVAKQAGRVLRRLDDLSAKYPSWPLEDLAHEWGRDLLAGGGETRRPVETFESWLSYQFGHLFVDGQPCAAEDVMAITTWITTPELERAGQMALRLRPGQRKQWLGAARFKNASLSVNSLDPVEFHRWIPLVADDMLMSAS